LRQDIGTFGLAGEPMARMPVNSSLIDFWENEKEESMIMRIIERFILFI
jgi:hypothetical protein